MTDYQPLIARAIEGLGKSTGEARRTLYERARSALVTQLRSVEPALSESEITRERLSLEEAIRKVEADAARKVPHGSAHRAALRTPPAQAAKSSGSCRNAGARPTACRGPTAPRAARCRTAAAGTP